MRRIFHHNIGADSFDPGRQGPHVAKWYIVAIVVVVVIEHVCVFLCGSAVVFARSRVCLCGSVNVMASFCVCRGNAVAQKLLELGASC